MITNKTTPKDMDEYIACFPTETKELLITIRTIIKNAAPDAVESISYQMPVFKLHGNLVYFAAYKHHIGFYPGAACVSLFEEDLKGYKTSKGTVQFPLDKTLPVDIITRIVQFRAIENVKKTESKIKKK